MFQPLCRALTDSGEIVVFTAKDIPVKLYSKYFALSLRPNSPLLRTETLTRAWTEDGVGEGDILEWRGEQWELSYEGSFILTSKYGVREPAQVCTDYKVIRISPHTNVKITCRFDKWSFPMLAFCGHIEGKALAPGCPVYIDPERVRVSTELPNQKPKVFFGDVIDGSEVTMQAGQVCLKRPDGLYDFASKLYLGVCE